MEATHSDAFSDPPTGELAEARRTHSSTLCKARLAPCNLGTGTGGTKTSSWRDWQSSLSKFSRFACRDKWIGILTRNSVYIVFVGICVHQPPLPGELWCLSRERQPLFTSDRLTGVVALPLQNSEDLRFAAVANLLRCQAIRRKHMGFLVLHD